MSLNAKIVLASLAVLAAFFFAALSLGRSGKEERESGSALPAYLEPLVAEGEPSEGQGE